MTSQFYVEKHAKMFRLFFRHAITWRACFFTVKIEEELL